jgi:hypothetical protein
MLWGSLGLGEQFAPFASRKPGATRDVPFLDGKAAGMAAIRYMVAFDEGCVAENE